MGRIHPREEFSLLQHLYAEYDRAAWNRGTRKGLAWIMSPGWLHEVRMLADGSGRPYYDPPDYSYANGPSGYGMLFGCPVHVQADAGLPRLRDGYEIFTGTVLFRARPVTLLDLA